MYNCLALSFQLNKEEKELPEKTKKGEEIGVLDRPLFYVVSKAVRFVSLVTRLGHMTMTQTI